MGVSESEGVYDEYIFGLIFLWFNFKVQFFFMCIYLICQKAFLNTGVVN